MTVSLSPWQIQIWNIDRFVFYVRNPRKNHAAVDRMCASIREFGSRSGPGPQQHRFGSRKMTKTGIVEEVSRLELMASEIPRVNPQCK